MNSERREFDTALDRTGVLLVGHGTRSEPGTEQFLSLADYLSSAFAPTPLEPAFLELRLPDIDTAVGRLLARGINRLVTVPLLLFAAGHAKEDVPAAVSAALARWGAKGISQRQTAHFGCHAALLELSDLRLAEALADKTPGVGSAPSVSQLCIFVGRGSRDQSAIAEMHELARLKGRRSNIEHQVAFAALAQPNVENVLAAAASRGYGRVIVQPHLLFEGEVLDTLVEQVRQSMASHLHGTEWVLTRALVDGGSLVTAAREKIGKVIIDRCHEVGIRVVARGVEA